ncbi:hypothetical protein Ga0100231_013580 [Opitutaceae bacterium TAV4]|nr:hypothetical protein Ga0100231_013580 [Opitutaceae bacterium TAV4]RRJ99444.1 hypothetical protein Ga0100230_014930 [Opitutaceae bacterium TAV3]
MKKILLLVFALIAIASSYYLYSRVTTPEDAWNAIVSAYKNGDITKADTYKTETGKIVSGWLFAQPWIDKKLKPKIVEKIDKGDRYEIGMIFNEPDGSEKVRMIFFKEEGKWKFHDLWLDDLKGDHYQMFLSKFIVSPKMASIEFAVKNPGKLFGSAFSVVADGVQKGYTWIEAKIYNLFKTIIIGLVLLVGIALGGLFIYDWSFRKITRRG